MIVQVDGRFDAVEGSHLPGDLPMGTPRRRRRRTTPGALGRGWAAPRVYPSRSDLVAEYPHLSGHTSAYVDGEVYLPFRVERADDAPLDGWLWLGWSDEHVTTPQTQRMKRAVTTYVARALERAELLAARAAVAYTLQSALLTKAPGGARASGSRRATSLRAVGNEWVVTGTTRSTSTARRR